MRVLVSVTPRDGLDVGQSAPSGQALLAPFAACLGAAGLEHLAICPATADDVAALGSTWAKRLGVPARRPAWLLVARQPALARDVPERG